MFEQVITNVISALITSKYALYILAFTVVFWILYVSVMSLYGRRKQLLTGIAFYLLLPVGFIVDVSYNWTVAQVLFWDLAKEVTLSQRLVRYIEGEDGWRKTGAIWICKHLIEPWDQGHCKLQRNGYE